MSEYPIPPSLLQSQQNKEARKKYLENYERIFGKKESYERVFSKKNKKRRSKNRGE